LIDFLVQLDSGGCGVLLAYRAGAWRSQCKVREDFSDFQQQKFPIFDLEFAELSVNPWNEKAMSNSSQPPAGPIEPPAKAGYRYTYTGENAYILASSTYLKRPSHAEDLGGV
jgi:hypothetical protein